MSLLTYREEVLAAQSLRLAKYEDTGRIYEIEADSFPADEKAPLEGIVMRQKEASDFFYVYEDKNNGDIIGYVNGTCTTSPVITHESFERHEPEGSTLVVHSVTVQSSYRRMGNATFMLKSYLEKIKHMKSVTKVLLLCKIQLVKFYISCGFSFVGLSDVVHGEDPWYEMAHDLSHSRLLRQYQVDAFTTEPFRGNPAAVVLGMGSDEWMQNMASENNLAETAFIRPVLDDPRAPAMAVYDLRWFTPTVEVELCGHATLSTAHVLFEKGIVGSEKSNPIDTICFRSKYRGELIARRIFSGTNNSDWLVELDFPSSPPLESVVLETALLCEGLGINPVDVLYTGRAVDDLVIEVTPSAFRAIPSLKSGGIDFHKVASVHTRGVLVTCCGPLRRVCAVDGDNTKYEDEPEVDFISRGFFPRYGINEDPVTGSAHCTLAPYWSQKFACSSLVGFQQSQRGGWVRVRCEGDRVFLSGNSVTVQNSIILVG